MTETKPSVTPIFKEGKIEYLGNYGQPYLGALGNCGVDSPGSHFQAHNCQESDWKQPA